MKQKEYANIQEEATKIVRTSAKEVKERISEFYNYTSLLGTNHFRITCAKPLPEGGSKTFLLKNTENEINLHPVEILAQWREIERANNNGYNVYVTPVPEDNNKEIYILVDDLTSTTLEEMKQDGFKPTIVLESSPNNYQAIIVVEKNFLETDERAKNINKAAANRLMTELNTIYGDKNIRAAIHPHRIPGMNNNKLKRIAENGGIPPKVKLVECSIDPVREAARNKQTLQEQDEKKIGIGVHCNFAQQRFNKYISEESIRIKQEEANLARITASTNKFSSGTIDPITAFVRHANDIIDHYGVVDYSRLDAEIVMRMRATGYSTADIKIAVEKGSPAIRPKEKRNKQWANYAIRTAKYSESFSCAQKIKEQEHRIRAWIAVEGRNTIEQKDSLNRK